MLLSVRDEGRDRDGFFLVFVSLLPYHCQLKPPSPVSEAFGWDAMVCVFCKLLKVASSCFQGFLLLKMYGGGLSSCSVGAL